MHSRIIRVIFKNTVIAMDRIAFPKIIFAEALPPSVMAFGDGAYGRSLSSDEVMRVRPSFKKTVQRACMHS